MSMLSCSSHWISLLNDFSVQVENNEFTDCCLIAEGKVVRAHQAVVSAHSSFFEEIIRNHHHSEELVFIIDGTCYEDLQLIIQFLYKGVITVTSSQIDSFLVLAELLGMKWVDKVTAMSHLEGDFYTSSKNQLSSFRNMDEPSASAASVWSSKCLPLENITNTVATVVCCKNKTKCTSNNTRTVNANKKSGTLKKPDELDNRCGSLCNSLHNCNNSSTETNLARVDVNTFCTMLGLQKNRGNQSHSNSKGIMSYCDASQSCKSVASSSSQKIIRIISAARQSSKSELSSQCAPIGAPSLVLSSSASNYVRESNPVIIDSTNLSLLTTIAANDLCSIRENNIEIDCDVLDVAAHQIIIEKSSTALRLTEGNVVGPDIIFSSDPGDDRELGAEPNNPFSSRGKVSGERGDGESRPVSTATWRSKRKRVGKRVSTRMSDCAETGGYNGDDDGDRSNIDNDNGGVTTSAAGESGAINVECKDSYGRNDGRRRSTIAVGAGAVSGAASGVFWCDECRRTYHTKTGLNQHKRYECCKDPAFACPRCEKRFKRKSSLVRHAITLHNEAVYPTRTKLLSKLTSARTIAGRR